MKELIICCDNHLQLERVVSLLYPLKVVDWVYLDSILNDIRFYKLTNVILNKGGHIRGTKEAFTLDCDKSRWPKPIVHISELPHYGV